MWLSRERRKELTTGVSLQFVGGYYNGSENSDTHTLQTRDHTRHPLRSHPLLSSMAALAPYLRVRTAARSPTRASG